MCIYCFYVLLPKYQEGPFAGFKRQGCVVEHKWRIYAKDYKHVLEAPSPTILDCYNITKKDEMPFALGHKRQHRNRGHLYIPLIPLLSLHKVTGARMAIQYTHAYGLCGTSNRTNKNTDNESPPLGKKLCSLSTLLIVVFGHQA